LNRKIEISRGISNKTPEREFFLFSILSYRNNIHRKEVIKRMKIFNATPHNINIVVNSVSDPTIRKMVTDKPEITMVIPSNGMLSAKINTVEASNDGGLPVFRKEIVGCDELPEGYEVIIASALYCSAVRQLGKDTTNLYTVADPVYTTDGKTIVGSRGICPFF
jgi:hypothetical protein